MKLNFVLKKELPQKDPIHFSSVLHKFAYQGVAFG